LAKELGFQGPFLNVPKFFGTLVWHFGLELGFLGRLFKVGIYREIWLNKGGGTTKGAPTLIF